MALHKTQSTVQPQGTEWKSEHNKCNNSHKIKKAIYHKIEVVTKIPTHWAICSTHSSEHRSQSPVLPPFIFLPFLNELLLKQKHQPWTHWAAGSAASHALYGSWHFPSISPTSILLIANLWWSSWPRCSNHLCLKLRMPWIKAFCLQQKGEGLWGPGAWITEGSWHTLYTFHMLAWIRSCHEYCYWLRI